MASTQIRFGYIVGRKVGNAVTRNYTKRRFRDITQQLLKGATDLEVMPTGDSRQTPRVPAPYRVNIIWRLNATAAEVKSDVIQRDVQRVWKKATQRLAN